jgi:hypothetical protein
MSTGRDFEADGAATGAVMAGRRPIADGRTNWLGHQLGSGAGQIDEMLLSGATLAEMARARGAAENHLRHLREAHGLDIVESGGVFRFAAGQAAAPAAAPRPAVPPSAPPPPAAPGPAAEPPQPVPAVEITGTVTTRAGDPTGRMQRTKMLLEIAAVAVSVIGGVVALVLRLRS